MPLQRRLPKRGFRNPIARRVRRRQPRPARRASPPAASVDPRRARARAASSRKRPADQDASATATLDARAHRSTGARLQRSRARRSAIDGRGRAASRCVEVLEGFSNALARPGAAEAPRCSRSAMLAVYRLGVRDPDARHRRRRRCGSSSRRRRNNIVGLVNLFSGGALERFSIFALGIMPYISASHHPAAADGRRPVPREALEGGRARAGARSPSTRATAPSCCRSSRASSSRSASRQIQAPAAPRSCSSPGWGFRLMTMITLTPAPRSSCGSASRSPSAASATASR